MDVRLLKFRIAFLLNNWFRVERAIHQLPTVEKKGVRTFNPDIFHPTGISPHREFTPGRFHSDTSFNWWTHGKQVYTKNGAIDKMMKW